MCCTLRTVFEFEFEFEVEVFVAIDFPDFLVGRGRFECSTFPVEGARFAMIIIGVTVFAVLRPGGSRLRRGFRCGGEVLIFGVGSGRVGGGNWVLLGAMASVIGA